MSNLSDVYCAVLEEIDTVYFGPLKAVVANFVATNQFSKKFVYRGCVEKLGRGLCKVFVEGPKEKHCHHDPLATGKYADMFRFELVLSDNSLYSNYGSCTLRASIWEVAGVLLNVSMCTFGALAYLEHFQLLHEKTKDAPECNMTFWVSSGAVSIMDLEIITNNTTLTQSQIWSSALTPRRVGSNYHTPTLTPVHTNPHASPLPLTVRPSARAKHGRIQGSDEVPTTSSLSEQPTIKESMTSAEAKEQAVACVFKRLADVLSASLDLYFGYNRE